MVSDPLAATGAASVARSRGAAWLLWGSAGVGLVAFLQASLGRGASTLDVTHSLAAAIAAGGALTICSLRRALRTAREQAAVARRDAHTSEELFQQLAENVRDVFWVVDDQDRMLYVSPGFETLFGRSRASLYENTWSFIEVVHPEDRARLAMVRFGIDPLDGEYRLLRDDGTQRWIYVKGIYITNEAGQLYRMVGITEDITERKRGEELRRRFMGRIIQAQEDERGRIARELHDTLAQSLTSLLVWLRSLDDILTDTPAHAILQELRALTGRTIDDAQRLARGLRPSVLDDLGFAPAVERLVQDGRRAHGIPIDLHLRFDTAARMDAEVETALYRILQEALTNAVRHSQATHIEVLIERDTSHVRAVVEDNGCGFDVPTPPAPQGGLGLLGMQERASLLQGELTINSAKGQGTTLYIRLPLKRTPVEI
ncbi:MAG TPA: ATP-binding protein [Myxococcota bacterium]|nr:ATP-binding protein [Myxococcota bacterium]